MRLRLNPFRRRRSCVAVALPGFDPAYYLHWYPDVAGKKVDPLQHYLSEGWKEGRDPSAGFSTLGYLAANPDVASEGINPLLHFVNIGFAEARSGYIKDPESPVPLPNEQAGIIDAAHKRRLEVFLGLRENSLGYNGFPQGNIDEANRSGIYGWAVNCLSVNRPAEIEIFDDRHLVGTAITGSFRSDLKEYYHGSGRLGFSFEFNPPLDEYVDHKIIARRAVDKLVVGVRILPGISYEPKASSEPRD